jgi:hypothetical protein
VGATAELMAKEKTKKRLLEVAAQYDKVAERA